ncbi:MAG: imidazoleglycerol-phosphate dehydratase [Candidatus Thermoplasmatota archaeon]|nr:imidazoleglycerol-phosphate dehydratase [Candidatus Thermoplasmatota archaeon]
MKLKGQRETKETTVKMELTTGPQDAEVEVAWEHHGKLDEEVDEGMARHLYHTLLRYARLQGSLSTTGDLAHHVIEDAAILLGQELGAFARGKTLTRFGDVTMAMDDALVQVVLDAGGRAYYESELEGVSPLWDHVMRTIASEAHFTVHVLPIRGHDPHHLVEAALKALGMALHEALAPSDRLESTKGQPTYEEDAA